MIAKSKIFHNSVVFLINKLPKVKNKQKIYQCGYIFVFVTSELGQILKLILKSIHKRRFIGSVCLTSRVKIR